jgi:hypothetical protein
VRCCTGVRPQPVQPLRSCDRRERLPMGRAGGTAGHCGISGTPPFIELPTRTRKYRPPHSYPAGPFRSGQISVPPKNSIIAGRAGRVASRLAHAMSTVDRWPRRSPGVSSSENHHPAARLLGSTRRQGDAARPPSDSPTQVASWPRWCPVSKQVLPCRPRSSAAGIDPKENSLGVFNRTGGSK